MRQDMAPFENARPFDDPVGSETEAVVELLIGENRFGDIAARREDLYSHDAAASRADRRGSFFAHANFRRDSRHLESRPKVRQANGSERSLRVYARSEST